MKVVLDLLSVCLVSKVSFLGEGLEEEVERERVTF